MAEFKFRGVDEVDEIMQRALEESAAMHQQTHSQPLSTTQYLARSTELSRTQQSGISLMYGLFPPGTGQNFTDPATGTVQAALPNTYQPAPLFSIPRLQDFHLMGFDYVRNYCPNFQAFLKRQWASAEARDKQAANAQVLATLSDIFGAPITVENILLAADTMECYDSHGLLYERFPKVTRELFESVVAIREWSQLLITADTAMNCLTTASFMTTLLAQFQAAQGLVTISQPDALYGLLRLGQVVMKSTRTRDLPLSHTHETVEHYADESDREEFPMPAHLHRAGRPLSARGEGKQEDRTEASVRDGTSATAASSLQATSWPVRFMHYSAHDTTIFPILASLNNFDGVAPHYGAHLLFELHQQAGTNEYFVRMFYDDTALIPPFCDGKADCPFSAFAQHVTSCGGGWTERLWAATCGIPYPPDVVSAQQSQLDQEEAKSQGFGVATGALAGACVLLAVGVVYLYIQLSKARGAAQSMEASELPFRRLDDNGI